MREVVSLISYIECIDRYLIIHSYSLVILLDLSLTMHQLDAFK